MSTEPDKLREENDRLRREVAHLKGVDAEKQATIEALHEQVAVLSEQVGLLRKALFAQRRERFIPSPDQKLLFEPQSLGAEEGREDGASADDEDPSGDGDQQDDEKPGPSTGRRGKRTRFQFPQFLPVKRFEYPLPLQQRQCPCGCGQQLVVISEQVSRQLELVQADAYVAEHVRYTYGCPTTREGQYIQASEKPASINEKGVLGPSALAWLAQSKFERHLPLYRLQEELRTASGMWFSRSVLSGALVRTAERLLPLWDMIRSLILCSFYLRVDETTGRVLRPGTGATKLIYLWVYTGDADYPYQLFDYRLDRSRDGPREILGDYRGGLLTDGFSGYESLIAESDGRLVDLGCWAHVRRKFDESRAVTSHPLAHEALAWIWQLYDIEDRIVESPAEERLRVRQQESVPILNRLHERLVEAQPTVRPSSKLAEAIGYAVNRWNALSRYTTDPRYAIDNNASERSIRPSVIGRKNYQFFGSDKGGRAASIWYTIIQSARHNHVRVLPYLKDVFARLPQIVPEYLRVGDARTPFECLSAQQRGQLTALLPDRWLAAHPEHRSDERQRELDEATQRRRTRRRFRRPVKA